MTDLFLSTRKVESRSSTVGLPRERPNEGAWQVLSRVLPSILRVRSVFGDSVEPATALSPTLWDVDRGFTDVEIESGQDFLVVEAKRYWDAR